jgi:hypothetical protein
MTARMISMAMRAARKMVGRIRSRVRCFFEMRRHRRTGMDRVYYVVGVHR